ncbi:hypothetical protein [Aquabacterium sp.]|uniref:hypothetical protein n=1 Tax=Aquabacterium sp. TaxID=1872578 RepID=UPI0025C38DA9|nr:hypothetical protein [Aquabacterium sp.]
MHHTLYISGYNDGRARKAKRATHLAHEMDWQARLPPNWKDQVVGPLWVQVHRDHDVGAERWMGYNEDDQPCYCRYRFVISRQEVQPGEPDRRLSYCEDLTAWLLRDGRWVIHREILSQAERPTSYSFYSLSERMPR